MKKIIYAAVAVLALGITSCSSIHKTASVEEIETGVAAFSAADLNISSSKITFTYKPSKSERRGGNKNAIDCAVAEALKANGNADVLVAPQYEIRKRRGNVKQVTVTGYPATYTNFRVVNGRKDNK